tara:strand:- start:66 stop:302 length:237 start_codon:yes stop_codon:yes gene_type:complete
MIKVNISNLFQFLKSLVTWESNNSMMIKLTLITILRHQQLHPTTTVLTAKAFSKTVISNNIMIKATEVVPIHNMNIDL